MYLNYIATIGRCLLALLFIQAGLAKLVSPASTINYIASTGLPLANLLYLLSMLLEIVAGIALLIGFQTRIAAAILGFFTFAAAVIFHNDFSNPMQQLLFMKNLAITGGLLQIIMLGAPQLSIDAYLLRRATTPLETN